MPPQTVLAKATEEKTLQALVPRKPKALEVLANRLNVDPQKLYNTLKNTCFKGASDEEMLALVVCANTYNLDPLLKQLYAFPDKRGGIVPMVPIDGWAAIVNGQEMFDGCEFEFTWTDEAKRLPDSCTCSIYIKGRSKPMRITEFYAECFRNTEPWKNMPVRMLRHKAFMQCARLAFSVSGIFDEDEARDIIDVQAQVVSAPEFLGPPTTQNASEDAPPSEPAEKPVRPPKTPPAKPEPAKKATPEPVKEPEPEPLPVGEAESAQSDAPEEAAIMKWEDCKRTLTALMKTADISEDQIEIWLREQGKASSKQGVWDLSSSKLSDVIKQWSEVAPRIAEIQI